MQVTKHTPGPWYHDQRGYPHPDVKAVSGRNIACTWGVNNQLKTPAAAKQQKQVARANARLISAAPDMLTALKLCRQHMYDHARNTPDQAFNKLCDAITKAEGNQV